MANATKYYIDKRIMVSSGTDSIGLSGKLDLKAYIQNVVDDTDFVLTSANPTGGVGYETGAGGSVTQATNRATGVTLNKITGQVTTTATSLGTVTIVSHVVTNSNVAATDTIVVSKVSGDADTMCYVDAVAAGSFKVALRNNAASGADTTVFVYNFAVIKAVTS